MKPVAAVAALIASLALSASAAAETVVPPGNSAATQYTQAFPTSSGNAKANSGINGDSSPAKVLGSGNAKKLDSKGQVGQEVATLAAETAPAQSSDEKSQAPKPVKQRGVHRHHHRRAAGATGSGNDSSASGSGKTAAKEASGSVGGSGSSGLGEVLAQATGSSSGQLGLFLPLIILGTVLWSFNYLRRQRRQVG